MPAQATAQVVQPQTATAVEAPPFSASPAVHDSAPRRRLSPNVGPSDPGALPTGPDAAADLAQPPIHDPATSGTDYRQPAVGDGAMGGPGLAPPVGEVPPPSGLPESTFATDFAAAQALLIENRLDPALLILSRWYDDPRISEQEQAQLLPLLNQLAGTVIYSQEHLLLPAYEVQPGDTWIGWRSVIAFPGNCWPRSTASRIRINCVRATS